jgi:hypothetical protein
MKKILTLGFLLLGLQQLSAQTLPFYDLSYYDSPKCIKEKANSFAKYTLIPNKPDEAVGKSICQVAKAAGGVCSRRHGQSGGTQFHLRSGGSASTH